MTSSLKPTWYLFTMSRRVHHRAKAKLKKLNTNKTLDKITYTLETHKQKFTRSLRAKLQKQHVQVPKPSRSSLKSIMKFGSFNINGINIETVTAMEHILEEEKFDV